MSSVESFLINFPGGSWISSLMLYLLDCVHLSVIFCDMYCKKKFPCILGMFPPSVVFNFPPHT